MKQPKIVLLIFVSGKIVLTGAKVLFNTLFLLCSPWHLYLMKGISILSLGIHNYFDVQLNFLLPLSIFTCYIVVASIQDMRKGVLGTITLRENDKYIGTFL